MQILAIFLVLRLYLKERQKLIKAFFSSVETKIYIILPFNAFYWVKTVYNWFEMFVSSLIAENFIELYWKSCSDL